MDNIIFLVMRRMRQPLLILIAVYVVSITGLALIPGVDGQGHPYHLSLFQAFYVVSYTSTTIGFGELPYNFTDIQRLWLTFVIYISVVAWIYAIGVILALLQEKTFQQTIRERKFARQVRALREPFHLICGYGETGMELVQDFTDRGQHVVVMDSDEHKIALLRLQNLRDYVPSLAADVRIPQNLSAAGLAHPKCQAVVALTDDNLSNLKIAITAKLLHPDLKVICRADSHDIEANMASFGTNYIVDPYDTFAVHLSTAMQSPVLYMLHRWLVEFHITGLPEPIYPPIKGLWVICGFGRFGRAIYDRLIREDRIEVVVVESMPEKTGKPQGRLIIGRGTEAKTLVEAEIERAVALVAGTDDDANNLSIIMTAKEMNDDLFVIARQNHTRNASLFKAVHADMTMHPAYVVADKIRVLLASPMLYEFMSYATYEDENWVCELMSRAIGIVDHQVPVTRELQLSEENFPMLCDVIEQGGAVRLNHLLADVGEPHRQLACIALMLLRQGNRTLLPSLGTKLKIGDRLLLCGNAAAIRRMRRTLFDREALDFIMTGKQRVKSWMLRRLGVGDQKNPK